MKNETRLSIKILNSHTEFSSNLDMAEYANAILLTASTGNSIAIYRGTITTHHEGCEMPMFTLYPCFVQLLSCYVLVLALRSLTVPLKRSF